MSDCRLNGCPKCSHCGKEMYHSATTGMHECRNDQCPPKVSYRLEGQRKVHISDLERLHGS